MDMMPVDNIAVLVFGCLDLKSLGFLRATCKEMLRICSDDTIWKDIWKRNFKETCSISSNQDTRIMDLFFERKSKMELQHCSKLQRMVQTTQSRTGFENSLNALIEKLQVELFVEVNGVPCELMAFRKKSQQGAKQLFRVFSAIPAPNISTGALRFDLSSCLKVQIPLNLSLWDFASLKVLCRSQLIKRNSRRAVTVFEAHPKNTVESRDFEYTAEHGAKFVAVSSQRSSYVYEVVDNSVSLLIINLNHVDVLMGLQVVPAVHRPIADDLDSRYGLHGFTCNVSLRSFGQNWWSMCFKEVETRDELHQRSLTFPLLKHKDCQRDVSRKVIINGPKGTTLTQPSLYFRTDTFSGYIHDKVIVDLTVWDEKGNVFWSFSKCLTTTACNDMSFNYDQNSANFMIRCNEAGVGSFQIECGSILGSSDGSFGISDSCADLVVKECHLEILSSRIASQFPRFL